MNRIKDLRQAHGLTQEELGKKLNLQKSAISKYEKGIVTPNGDVLKRLSTIFNVSTDYLLGNEVARAEKFSDDETKLIHDYRWLDEDGKNLVLSMVKRLVGNNSRKTDKNIVVQHNKHGNNYGVVSGNFNSNLTLG